MVSIPSCSHHGGSGLIQPRYIVSQEFEDFRGVGAPSTRALYVDLAAKLLGERPPHSIDNKPALDPEDDVPKEGHSTRRTNVAAHPAGGERIGLEKTRERGTALPRIDVQRPARDIADHLLRREFVALKLGGLALFTEAH